MSSIEYESRGRFGYIHYYKDDKKLKLEWEMNGGDLTVCEILLLPLNLKEWREPKGVKISKDEQYRIVKDLNRLLITNGIKSDLSVILEKERKIEFEERACIWAGCNQNRIKGMVYCIEHYSDGLLVK